MSYALIAAAAGAVALASPYTLAGIHLRDTPAKARAALAKAGYRIVAVKRSDSYRQRLLQARALSLRSQRPKDRSVDVSRLDATLADQRIQVSFDDDEFGRRVVLRVSYIATDLAHPYDQVLSRLMERQGRPTHQVAQSTAWCEEVENCEAGGIPKTDMLAVRATNEGFGRNMTSVELQVGERTKRAWNAAHLADLQRSFKTTDGY